MNTVVNFIVGSMLGYWVVKEITNGSQMVHSKDQNKPAGDSHLYTSKSSLVNTNQSSGNHSHRITN